MLSLFNVDGNVFFFFFFFKELKSVGLLFLFIFLWSLLLVCFNVHMFSLPLMLP